MRYILITITLLMLFVPADSLRANCHEFEHGFPQDLLAPDNVKNLCCCETYGGGQCCQRVLICNTSMLGCGCKY